LHTFFSREKQPFRHLKSLEKKVRKTFGLTSFICLGSIAVLFVTSWGFVQNARGGRWTVIRGANHKSNFNILAALAPLQYQRSSSFFGYYRYLFKCYLNHATSTESCLKFKKKIIGWLFVPFRVRIFYCILITLSVTDVHRLSYKSKTGSRTAVRYLILKILRYFSWLDLKLLIFWCSCQVQSFHNSL
jgi:hypothetical protein